MWYTKSKEKKRESKVSIFKMTPKFYKEMFAKKTFLHLLLYYIEAAEEMCS